MAITVNTTDTFEQWRVKTNQLGADVDSNIAAVRADIASNVTTLNSNIAGVRADLVSNIAGVRADLVSNIAGVRADLVSNIAGVRADLVSNIAAVRADIASNVVTLNSSITSNVNAILANTNSATGNIITGNLTVNLISRLLGNVGIGTSSPAARIHANSNTVDEVARFDSNANSFISIYSKGNLQGTIGTKSSSGGFATITLENYQFGAANHYAFRSQTSSGGVMTDRLVISGSGFVGIGTSSPTSNLHVVGTGNITGNVSLSNAMTIVSTTGRVGIGTSSPSYKLHVANASSTVDLGLSTSAQNFSIQVVNSSGGGPVIPSTVNLNTDADRFTMNKELSVTGSFSATSYGFTTLNAIGSIIVALYVPGTHPGTSGASLNVNDTVSGSLLYYNYTGGVYTQSGDLSGVRTGGYTRYNNTTYLGGGSTLSGTWRCIGRPGYFYNIDELYYYTWIPGLFVRVS